MSRSEQLFAEANRYIPGGVNSPVRACRSVGATPNFVAAANGSRITTVDGDELVDFVLSWGPMLLGHNHALVSQTVHSAVDKGLTFGAPCESEVSLARAVVEAVPSVEMVRMVNSGTEATMSALRLARGVTEREKVVKFTGCYHGHADPFLAAAGSGVATYSVPGSPGVPEGTVSHTLLSPYNDLESVKAHFADNPGEIAAVIVEPVAGNMGLVLPKPGFLQGLRELCDANGALLIFDEVITGFRLDYGGAGIRFGVTADLTTMGKVLGGGMPVGAFGGKAEYMEKVSPCGPVYQAGTLAGNPVAMAAGLATLNTLANSDYAALENRTADLANEMAALLAEKGVPVQLNKIASIFTIFFAEEPVYDFDSAAKGDAALFNSFWTQMRAAGVNLAPSPFECAFTSFAHTDEDCAKTLEAVKAVSF